MGVGMETGKGTSNMGYEGRGDKGGYIGDR